MVKTKIGISEEFPWCIRDGEVYCSTLCKYGKWERSPLDEDVKAFETKEDAEKYSREKCFNIVEIVIPYKEWEVEDAEIEGIAMVCSKCGEQIETEKTVPFCRACVKTEPDFREEEFCLENEIINSDSINQNVEACDVIKVWKVKEFIKNIRKELKDPKLDCWGIDKIINKHAGKRLID